MRTYCVQNCVHIVYTYTTWSNNFAEATCLDMYLHITILIYLPHQLRASDTDCIHPCPTGNPTSTHSSPPLDVCHREMHPAPLSPLESRLHSSREPTAKRSYLTPNPQLVCTSAYTVAVLHTSRDKESNKDQSYLRLRTTVVSYHRLWC